MTIGKQFFKTSIWLVSLGNCCRFPRQDQPSKIVYLLINQICLIFNATHVPTYRSFWGVYENDTKSFTPLTMFSDIQFGLADIAGIVLKMSNKLRIKIKDCYCR